MIKTELNLKFSDANGKKIVDAICYNQKYKETVASQDGSMVQNPQSKEDFVKEILKNYIKKEVRRYEASKLEDIEIQ